MMKRMNQKLFAALLACALCGALAPAGAWADVKIDAKNFPDENFRRWVKENAAGGKNVLTDAQRAAMTEMVAISYEKISSLKGIEHFTALEDLRCSGNPITELDLSHNTKLGGVCLPVTARVVLPNGERIDMADFQLRRTAAGKFHLDLSRHAGKIEKVRAVGGHVDGDIDIPVTSSGGVYTFDFSADYVAITYKLGRREGKDWTLALTLDLFDFTKNKTVPLVEAEAPKGKGARPAGRQIETAPPKAGAIEVTVVNELDEKVLLAMGKKEDGRLFSRGWWSVEPGATRTIRPFEGSGGDYFFRAVTESGERMWHGSDEYDSSFFWLHSTKAFDCLPGKKVRGGKKGRFHFFPQIYWKNKEDPKDGFILKFRKDTWDLDDPD